MSKAWTLEDIERQAARGGVNRQQAEQLIADVRLFRKWWEQASADYQRVVECWFEDNDFWEKQVDDLYDAIIRHRNVWANTTSRGDPRRDDANDVLWSLVEQQDG